MGYNYNKLRGAIRESFDNQAEFAKALGMGEATLSLKLNNKSEWTQEEMILAMRTLNKPLDQIGTYFFAH